MSNYPIPKNSTNAAPDSNYSTDLFASLSMSAHACKDKSLSTKQVAVIRLLVPFLSEDKN